MSSPSHLNESMQMKSLVVLFLFRIEQIGKIPPIMMSVGEYARRTVLFSVWEWNTLTKVMSNLSSNIVHAVWSDGCVFCVSCFQGNILVQSLAWWDHLHLSDTLWRTSSTQQSGTKTPKWFESLAEKNSYTVVNDSLCMSRSAEGLVCKNKGPCVCFSNYNHLISHWIQRHRMTNQLYVWYTSAILIWPPDFYVTIKTT